jgi:hypothetical protein
MSWLFADPATTQQRRRGIRWDEPGAEVLREPARPLDGDVGDENTDGCSRELLSELRAHAPDSLHQHRSAVELRRANRVGEAGADPVDDAARGEGRWIARAAARGAAAEDICAPSRQDVEVGRRRVHVTPGPEVAAEGRDRVAVSQQEPLALGALR